MCVRVGHARVCAKGHKELSAYMHALGFRARGHVQHKSCKDNPRVVWSVGCVCAPREGYGARRIGNCRSKSHVKQRDCICCVAYARFELGELIFRCLDLRSRS